MRISLLLAYIILLNTVQAKSFLVARDVNYLSGKDKKYSDIKGGDTILLKAGQRGSIQFANFSGLAGQYITIINADSLCEIKATTLPYGISLRNCHFVRLCGNGCAKIKYGIQIAEVIHDGAGLGISDKSDHIEICFVEICHTKGPGILCKTNPDCVTYRDNFTMVSTSIHNNYIHHTGTEGMYIGSTAFEGEKVKCGSGVIIRLPPMLDSVEVFDNEVSYTGWDGIQISDATNATCYHNTISFDSQKDEAWQNCGLIIGGGTSGRFYQNTIQHGKGYAINCFGTGKVEIAYNVIVMDSGSTKIAVYVNDKLAKPETAYLLNGNSITTPFLPAIKMVNKKHNKAYVLTGNKVNNASAMDAITYEGLKPVIK